MTTTHYIEGISERFDEITMRVFPPCPECNATIEAEDTIKPHHLATILTILDELKKEVEGKKCVDHISGIVAMNAHNTALSSVSALIESYKERISKQIK